MERTFSIPRGAGDLLKVIAAMMVVATHYLASLAASGAQLGPVLLWLWPQGGNIGVAVFFFLSGYGLMASDLHRHLSFREYVARRFLKVYLPVVLITALWLPVYYTMVIQVSIVSVFTIIKDLFFEFGDFILWFFRILIFLYIAFYIFAWQLDKGHRKTAIALLWLLTVVACAGCYRLYGSFGLAAMAKIPLFSVGVMTAMYSKKFYGIFNAGFIPLTICFVVFTLVLSLYLNFDENVMSNIYTYSTIAIIMLVFTFAKPKIKLPLLLAALTLDVYLVHYKVLAVIVAMHLQLSLPFYLTAVAVVAIIFYLLRTQVQKHLTRKIETRL